MFENGPYPPLCTRCGDAMQLHEDLEILRYDGTRIKVAKVCSYNTISQKAECDCVGYKRTK
jgi:hypothetical protein